MLNKLKKLVKETILIHQLIRFKDKAWCTYTEEQAQTIWKKIGSQIPNPYYTRISTEWGHVKCNHGKSQARMALLHEIESYIKFIGGYHE
jgi:hypothetical protein